MSETNRESEFDIIAEPDRSEIDAGKPAIGNPQPERTPEQSSGIGTIDPFKIDGNASAGSGNVGNAGTQPRRRGRPPGSKNRPADGSTPQKTSNDLGVNLEELLLSIHCMGAVFLQSPELELDDDEAKKIAHHLKKVSALYNHTFDPKTIIWCGFLFTLAEIYGTRGVAIYKRMTTDKKPVVVMPKSGMPESNPSTAPEKVVAIPSQLWPVEPIEDI